MLNETGAQRFTPLVRTPGPYQAGQPKPQQTRAQTSSAPTKKKLPHVALDTGSFVRHLALCTAFGAASAFLLQTAQNIEQTTSTFAKAPTTPTQGEQEAAVNLCIQEAEHLPNIQNQILKQAFKPQAAATQGSNILSLNMNNQSTVMCAQTTAQSLAQDRKKSEVSFREGVFQFFYADAAVSAALASIFLYGAGRDLRDKRRLMKQQKSLQAFIANEP